MAPIFKELEVPVATATTTAPVAPQGKSPIEAPARPQPVPLEIPVTVNGARTIDGSDKRQPFSETTRTVLVFPLGAVIRIATPLVPGQLVFLTNEKTKKEVVCQVVKSKTGGTTSGYMELQFTEPAPGFWGLLVSGTPAAPLASRPAPPAAAPAAPKTISAGPVSAAPEAAGPKPLALAPTFVTALKPIVAPPPPHVVMPETEAPQSLAPAIPASRVSVESASPVATVPEAPPAQSMAHANFTARSEVAPGASTAPAQSHPSPILPADAKPEMANFPFPSGASADSPTDAGSAPPTFVIPPVPVVPGFVPPGPALHDYSKEIETLFAVPKAPSGQATSREAREPEGSSGNSTPTTEELKLQATRLQAQLSSMLFTETPASPQAHCAAPVTEVAKKVLEIAQQEETKPLAKTEAVLPARKGDSAALSIDEEVKIPAWLAPISQNPEPTVSEPPARSEASSESPSDAPVSSEESCEVLVADGSRRPQTAVFGGQLFGESSAQLDEVSATGSRKGLFLGLAAAALMLIGGSAWYFRQNYSGSATVAAARPTPLTSPSMRESASVSVPAATTANHAPAASTAPTSQAANNTIAVPSQAVSTPAPEPRNSATVSRNSVVDEAPKKSALGEVHLGAPVVNHGAGSQQTSEAMPTVETMGTPAVADPLVAVGAIRDKEPVAPLPVGGNVKTARLIKSVPPVYPPMARQQRISGDVQIDALIDASGNVAGVKILSGPVPLHRAAQEAVKQWKYSPALLDGQPTSMHLTVTVQFRTQ